MYDVFLMEKWYAQSRISFSLLCLSFLSRALLNEIFLLGFWHLPFEYMDPILVKIPHLVELGVNAVELLPVFEFDEMEFQRRPNPRDHMVSINCWLPVCICWLRKSHFLASFYIWRGSVCVPCLNAANILGNACGGCVARNLVSMLFGFLSCGLRHGG